MTALKLFALLVTLGYLFVTFVLPRIDAALERENAALKKALRETNKLMRDANLNDKVDMLEIAKRWNKNNALLEKP